MSVKIVKLADPTRVWQAEGISAGLSGRKLLAIDSSYVDSSIKSGTLIQLWEGEEHEVTEELVEKIAALNGVPSKTKPAVELPTDVLGLQTKLNELEAKVSSLQSQLNEALSQANAFKLSLQGVEKANAEYVGYNNALLEEKAALENELKALKAGSSAPVAAEVVAEVAKPAEAVSAAASKTPVAPVGDSKKRSVPPLPPTGN
jgi:predicted transcriptional regulator